MKRGVKKKIYNLSENLVNGIIWDKLKPNNVIAKGKMLYLGGHKFVTYK